jgi:hypothetical protein
VTGVAGIIEAYKYTFKTGIAMSKPTNLCEVIRNSGKAAKSHLATAQQNGGQQYSILCILTNGNVHSVEETIAALNDVHNDPISIIVVGVGPSSFDDMKFLNKINPSHGGGLSRVQFVEMKNGDLAQEALNVIPEHLVQYFLSNNIKPNPPIEADDIVVEPYNEQEEEQEQKPNKKNELLEKVKKEGQRQVMRQAKRIFDQQSRKLFGRRRGRQPTKQQVFDKLLDQQVNKVVSLFK